MFWLYSGLVGHEMWFHWVSRSLSISCVFEDTSNRQSSTRSAYELHGLDFNWAALIKIGPLKKDHKDLALNVLL